MQQSLKQLHCILSSKIPNKPKRQHKRNTSKLPNAVPNATEKIE